MNYAAYKIVRKYPFIYVPLKKFHAKIKTSPFYYIKTLVSDPHHVRASKRWYRQIKKTQIRLSTPLFLDRQLEVEEFFKLNSFTLTKYFLTAGFPNSKNLKNE